MATTYLSTEKIDIGRVVQRGFQTIGRHALPFIGLALLLGGLPSYLTQAYLIGDIANADGAAVLGMFVSPLYWVAVLVTIICGYLLQGTLVRSSILDLSARDPDIGGSLAAALKLILPMIGLAILSGIIMGIGFLLLIVPGIILYIMLIVAVPVLVEERGGVIESMRRSRALTKGSRWRIFLLLLLFLIVYLIVSAAMGFIAGVAGENALPLAALAAALTASVVALLMAAMLASLYVELRTIKEGATAEGLAAIFD